LISLEVGSLISLGCRQLAANSCNPPQEKVQVAPRMALLATID